MTDEAAESADKVRENIDEARVDLAETVDALQSKLDVKARARSKAHEVSAAVSGKATELKQQAPPPVRDALERSATILGPVTAKAQPYRSRIAVGAGAAGLVLIFIARRRRSR